MEETITIKVAKATGLQEKHEQEGLINEELSISKFGNLGKSTEMDEVSLANRKEISMQKPPHWGMKLEEILCI